MPDVSSVYASRSLPHVSGVGVVRRGCALERPLRWCILYGSPCGDDGLWRSLVAHLTGGQGVVGSNPASPTIAFNQADSRGRAPGGLLLPYGIAFLDFLRKFPRIRGRFLEGSGRPWRRRSCTHAPRGLPDLSGRPLHVGRIGGSQRRRRRRRATPPNSDGASRPGRGCRTRRGRRRRSPWRR